MSDDPFASLMSTQTEFDEELFGTASNAPAPSGNELFKTLSPSDDPVRCFLLTREECFGHEAKKRRKKKKKNALSFGLGPSRSLLR